MEPISRKRKEREDLVVHTPSRSNNSRGKMVQPHPLNDDNTTSSKGWSNRLLAGYMAHEFLTRGTLLGQILDPSQINGGGKSSGAEQRNTYGEVSCLVKSGNGAHIAGIVNPTQLARWIQM